MFVSVAPNLCGGWALDLVWRVHSSLSSPRSVRHRMTTYQRTCFLSAPAGATTRALREALRRIDVETVDPADFVSHDSTLFASVAGAIERADFVCVLLPAHADASRGLVEAGIALGMGKRVLVLAAESSPRFTEFPQLAWLTIEGGDPDDFELPVRAFVEHIEDIPLSKSKSSGAGASTYSVDVQWARDVLETEPLGIEAKELVAQLLRLTGDSVRVPAAEQAGARLVAWLSESIPRVGNPLLVEVKTGILTKHAFAEGVEGLRSYLSRAQLTAGLLVYGDSRHGHVFSPPAGDPIVLVMSIPELIDAIGSGTFSNALAQQAKTVALARA